MIDWVSGEIVWYAHLLNRKPRKDEGEIPAGPHTDIFTRSLTADQVAQRLTMKLRQYVSQLERAGDGKP